jgi:hypothetical protein
MRERLFNQLSAKLAAFEPHLGSGILCPVCWRRFNLDSAKTGELSIDHVPPSAVSRLLGERAFQTLVCKSCNNTAGSQYQNDLKQFVVAQLHWVGKYAHPIRGTITLEGTSPLRSNIIWTPDKVQVIGVPKANKRSTVRQHTDALNTISDGSTVKLSLRYDFMPSKAWAACLYTAYLLVYILSDGYYSFTKAGIGLRKLINAASLDQLGACVIEPQTVGVGGRPWIVKITDPPDLRCTWVKVAGNIVIMPMDNDEELRCYAAWQSICDNSRFGLKPRQPLHIRVTFRNRTDATEAAKCLPKLLSNLPHVSD